MQRVGKRLSARRASPGMAFALAQRRNTAGDRFPARSRALATMGNRPLLGLRASTGCSVPTRPEPSRCIRQKHVPRHHFESGYRYNRRLGLPERIERLDEVTLRP